MRVAGRRHEGRRDVRVVGYDHWSAGTLADTDQHYTRIREFKRQFEMNKVNKKNALCYTCMRAYKMFQL